MFRRQWSGAWFSYTLDDIAAQAPKESGVYAIAVGIIGGGTQWIYIGGAGDVQDRLKQHCSGQSEKSLCISAYGQNWFSYEVWIPSLRAKRERELIRMYQPACNERLG